ncbi:MAG: hypothetical protein LBB91_08115 [Clostridiales bacterium]|jgi:hypothetical protein|nr:hypothetical protein [Clostridiales bacterium]
MIEYRKVTKILTAILVLIMLLTLAACWGKGPNVSEDEPPEISTPAQLSADEARAIYNMWLDAHFADHEDISAYTLSKQSNEIYELGGEDHYLFHADEMSMYWYNILVHMKTGELLIMITPDGEDQAIDIEPLDDWYDRYYKVDEEDYDDDIPLRVNNYLRRYGNMPLFSDISQIDQEWLIFNLFYLSDTHNKDAAPYGFDYFVTIADIEKAARKYINPQIQMAYEADFPEYENSYPAWNPELNGFMWNGTGGSDTMYDYLLRDIKKQNGLFYITCIEVKISWDEEYEWRDGIVYIGAEIVGSATFDGERSEIDYTFNTGQDDLEKRLFVLRENGNDEYGEPLFIIDSKTNLLD